jgi:hypothetical protein
MAWVEPAGVGRSCHDSLPTLLVCVRTLAEASEPLLLGKSEIDLLLSLDIESAS